MGLVPGENDFFSTMICEPSAWAAVPTSEEAHENSPELDVTFALSSVTFLPEGMAWLNEVPEYPTNVPPGMTGLIVRCSLT